MVNDMSNGHSSPLTYNIPNSAGSSSDYLYDIGFEQGQFSDITLSVPSLHTSFALHSLILAQSPALCRLLPAASIDGVPEAAIDTTPPSIEFDFQKHSIKSVVFVLGYLYRPLSPTDIHNELNPNAPLQSLFDLLDCASLLELDPLQTMLHTMIRDHRLDPSSVSTWIATLRPFRDQNRPWAAQVDNHILSYLTLATTKSKPNSIKISGRVVIGAVEAHGYMPSKISSKRLLPGLQGLTDVYAALPADYLVHCLEHPNLSVQDDIQRFHFATRVLRLREKQGQRDLMAAFRVDTHGKSSISILPRARRKRGKWDPSRYGLQ